MDVNEINPCTVADNRFRSSNARDVTQQSSSVVPMLQRSIMGCVYLSFWRGGASRTDRELVVVGDLFAWVEIPFRVNDNLRLIRDLDDLSIAVRLAAMVDKPR